LLVEHELISFDTLKLLAAKNISGNHSKSKQCYEDALTFANPKLTALLRGKCVPAGGHQSLDVLSNQFKLILLEYLQSHDKEGVSARVKEMKVSHFNHDFVYQAGIIALEKMHDAVMMQLAELFKYMHTNEILLESCLQKGYERLYACLGDLSFDLPAAYNLARRWVDKSLKAGFIGEELAKKCPIRRTLSRGTDGKLSCVEDENDENADVTIVNIPDEQDTTYC
jgi:hypothetical protein